MHMHHVWMQVVQKQLGASEKTDKNDDSPVTVADYGKSPEHLPTDPMPSVADQPASDRTTLACPHGMNIGPHWTAP